MKKHLSNLIILLAIVCVAVFAVSCMENAISDTNSTSDSLSSDVTTSDTITDSSSSGSAEENEPTELVLYENGTFNFSITRSSKMSDLTPFSSFLSRLKQISEINKISLDTDEQYRGHEYDPNKKEILFGYTAYPESLEGMSGLGFYEYRVTCIGNKIVISVRNEEDLTSAAALFIDYVRKNEKDGKVVIPKDLYLFEEKNCEYPMLSAKRIPSPTGYSSVALSDCGDGFQQATLYDASLESFNDYKAKLASSGFTLYTENNMAGNLFATYTKGSYTVHTYFIPELSEMKIVAFENSPLPSLSAGEFDKVCDPAFVLLGIEINSDTTGGLGCIVRLKDGSFIIIDGGYNNATNANIIANTLKSLAPNPKKIIIRAWIITHGHSDHYGAFINFSKIHAGSNIFTVESFIFNGCDTKQQQQYNVAVNFESTKNAINTYWKNVPIYKCLTGQVYKFAGCDIEILYCMSDFLPMTVGEERSDADLTKVDGNLQNIVFRMYMEGQSILVTGDTSKYNVDEMCDIYGDYLKSDMITVPHHGHNKNSYRARNGTVELYQLVDPAIVFWPAGNDAQASRLNWNGLAGANFEANYYLLYNLHVKKCYVAGNTNTTVTLPHNP